MAGAELILDMQSPALAVVVLSFSVLPLITTVVHHGRRCIAPTMVVLPVRMRDLSATMSTPADTTLARNSTEGVAKAGGSDIC